MRTPVISLARIALVVAVAALPSCATRPSPVVFEYFDEASVTAITRAREAVLFTARQPQLSAMGGDMLSVGPVLTIVSGREEQYLWIGFWTTVDRFRVQSELPGPPDVITFDADGAQVRLSAAAPLMTLDGRPARIYERPTSGAIDTYYSVTSEQLAVLAQAQNLAIDMPVNGGRPTTFVAQDRLGPVILEFLAYTGVDLDGLSAGK